MNPDHDLHSDDLERALIGCVLVDPYGFVLDAFMSVPSSAYWGERNRVIATRIRSMADREATIDLVNVTEELRQAGELEKAGSVAYLLGCAADAPSGDGAPDYATRLLDLASRRSLARFSQDALLLARDRSRSLEEVYGEIEERLTSVTRTVSAAADIDTYAEQAAAVLDGETRGDYFQTGLQAFDTLVGGMKGLVIVGARPSMGKSSLVRDILRHQHKQGRKVALFSQDQAGNEVLALEASLMARVPFHTIVRNTASGKQRALWKQALLDVRDSWRNSYAVDDRPHNLHALGSRIRAAARWGAELIAVDYLQLVDVPGVRDGNPVIQTGMVSKALKRLTQELGVPILALAQLSRAVESRQDKRPMLSDLRESGQVEQDAQTVVFLYRPEYYVARAEGRAEELENWADLIVAKNKTGPSGTARVLFNTEYATFGKSALY